MENGVGMNTTAVPRYVIYTAFPTFLLTNDRQSLFNSLQICIIAIITRDHKGVYDGPFKFACHTKSKQVRGVRLKGKEGHVGL